MYWFVYEFVELGVVCHETHANSIRFWHEECEAYPSGWYVHLGDDILADQVLDNAVCLWLVPERYAACDNLLMRGCVLVMLMRMCPSGVHMGIGESESLRVSGNFSRSFCFIDSSDETARTV